MKKGFLSPAIVVLVGLLTLAGIISLAFYLGKKSPGPTNTNSVVQASPTADATANWKTYTAKTFSVNYPNGWEIYSQYNDNYGHGIVIRAPYVQQTYQGVLIDRAIVTIQTPVAYGTGGNLIDTIPASASDCEKNIFVADITVDGRRAKKYDYSCPGPSKGTIIYIQNKDGLYSIAFEHLPLIDQSYHLTFDQILSTFKFVN